MQDAVRAAGDDQFFARTGPHGLAALVQAVGGELRAAPGGEGLHLVGVAPLQTAGPEHVSFLDNKRYAGLLDTTQAGAVILAPALADRLRPETAGIVVPDAYEAWARIAALFHPPAPLRPGVHPSAVVEAGATIDPTAEVGPLAVVREGAVVGPRCRVDSGAVIGRAVQLGADCRIGAQVTISHAVLGERVNILPGARIGQEGFGFAQTRTGFITVPQLGRVLIADDVDIGANTTIDRGSAQDTVIGAGSRIDNLVQIGHNVKLGRCCVIVAMAGISGSTELGDFVVVAAQAGLTGHLSIGSKARIGAQAGVMGDVPAGQDVIGSPAEPVREFFRGIATLRKLSRRPKGGSTPTE